MSTMIEDVAQGSSDAWAGVEIDSLDHGSRQRADFVGARSGLHVVVSAEPKRDGDASRYWKTRCTNCARIRIVPTGGLFRDRKCVCGGRKPPEIGTRFNFLVVVGEPVKKNRIIRLPVRCDCGRASMPPIQNVLSGKAKTCGCRRHLSKYPDPVIGHQYSTYRSQAHSRGRAFELTYDQFLAIVSRPCCYCNLPPPIRRQGKIAGAPCNGVDRIDSDLGYIPGNVVPCCARCNWMKLDESREDFLDHIARIATHQKLIQQAPA